ncbi:hypothetical protein INT43_003659, partial [Umbelopsis isabellina]
MCFKNKKRTAVPLIIAGVVAIALVLGLAIGLTREHSSNTNSTSSNAVVVQNFPQEFLLSGNNFTISNQTTIRYYEFNVSQINGSPDGYQRTMLVVNGQYPGPLVECNIGDQLVIKVNNQLPDGQGTSIHWHGMYQTDSNWMDGTVGVTQCPIPPGQSFTYNFTVSEQRGTYWWHSHMQAQYTDGILGPLVIHDPSEPSISEYDEDLVMILTADWYHDISPVNMAIFLSPDNYEASEPVPDSGLINGLNTFNCSGATNTSVACTGGNRANFTFTAGKRYRIRVINTSAIAEFDFSIDGHNLTVVEADGVPMKPVTIDRIPINVAQRYSVIVEANQPVGNYWVRAVINENCLAYTNPALNPTVLAGIHYEGAPDNQPNSTDPGYGDPIDCIDLDSSDLHPFDGLDAPDYNVSYYIEATFQATAEDRVHRGYMNTTTWKALANTSTLQEANSGLSSFGNNQFVLTLPDNVTVVQLIIQNLDDGDHPFHLHGHTFWILGTGSGYFGANPSMNTTNPTRRDTATVPAYGYAIIRFIPHPGMWFFHCHISWHAEAGLGMQIQYRPDLVK